MKARQLDEYLEINGKPMGSLHGVPVSLKDQVNLPGVETTIGYISYLGNKPTQKSILAKVLEDNGAIFYVKTTVPMAMMAPETASNLNGYTLNARNIEFSSGGSSGGEGALIGARASVLGVGTDIGGSIRIPASFQGLYGLRPSHGRIPYMNVTNSYAGQEVVPSVIGPLASSLEDIELFAKSVVDAETWEHDPKVVAIPWREMNHLQHKKLRFGIMWWDRLLMPHPPITRALKMAIEVLKKNGHEVIEWNFPYQKDVLELADKIFGADGGFEIEECCRKSGEQVMECVRPLVQSTAFAESRTVTPITVNEWWCLAEQKTELREKFLKYWRETAELTSDDIQIDALICPVWPTAGFEINCVEYAALNYTVPFNVLDCACVVLPVTKVDKNLDTVDEDYDSVDAIDEKIRAYYDPQKFDGMPVCIQVVCKRLEEEKVLAIASILEQCLAT